VGHPRIVVIGSTMIDLIAYAARLPEAGETVTGTAFRSGFGGKGANQAVAAARFGAEVSMVNTVGDDDHGAATLANFAVEGVATDDMRVVPGASGVAPIWVDAAGMNRIVIVPGTNLLVPADLAIAAVERIQPDVVVGQFEIPQAVTAAGFAAAKAAGAVTVLNPAPGAAIAPELLVVTDWLVPNETEFELIGGSSLDGGRDDAARIADLGDRLGVSLVVTLGARGVVLRPLGTPATAIPAPVVAAVDTTGAGDAFVGAFAVGVGLGWPPERAATLGCAAASDSVTRPGTQSSYPDRVRAAALLAEMERGAAHDSIAMRR
jgi:ribokinase